MKKRVRILAIETSCDETGLALVDATMDERGAFRIDITQNLLHSQIALHKKTGGVVPEIAAREHAIRLPKLLATLTKKVPLALLKKTTDAIAVTSGPGLVTSLVIGVEVARTLALMWNKPLIPVNHLEGHIYANLLAPTLQHKSSNESGLRHSIGANSQWQMASSKWPVANGGKGANQKSNKTQEAPQFLFPLLALLVSGGHTELILMKRHLSYTVLGSTRDDAAGEAFDKTAKLLGLPYPGGPALSRLAQQGKPTIPLPRPMLLNKTDLDFSFSGLKTAVAVRLEKGSVERADMAASIETAIVETLVEKTCRAAIRFSPAMVVLAGGVAANSTLRKNLATTLAQRVPGMTLLVPVPAYATDNGAMIAAAGAVRFLLNKKRRLLVDPHLPL